MSAISDFKNYRWRKMAKANLPFSFVKFAIGPSKFALTSRPAGLLMNEIFVVRVEIDHDHKAVFLRHFSHIINMCWLINSFDGLFDKFFFHY